MKRTISLIALLVTLLLVSCGKLNFSNKVIVEFDTKGGSEIGSKILNKDASLNEPNPPTKEGYSFLGWYSDSDYDNEIESFPLTIERDLILYAKWEINTYSLTFLVDEEVYFYQEHQFNEEVLIPLEPHQEGYTFGGWDLEIPFLMPGNDLVITGNLIKNSSALIFHYSENENETVSYQYPEETSAPTEPEKTGYRFLGWYLESELETAFIFGNPLLKDYDLYPKWVKEYQISFVENGGTKVNTLILTEEDDRENLPISEKEGNTFLGWYYDEELLMPFSFSNELTADFTLYAKWEPNTYSLTFLVDEEIYLEKEYYFNEAIETVQLPQLEGYTFSGWDVEIPLFMPSNDLVIKGEFGLNSYQISFYLDEEEYSYNFLYNEEINLEEPFKSGYYFKGFYWDSEFEEPFNLVKMPATNLIIYPYFTLDNYLDHQDLILNVYQENINSVVGLYYEREFVSSGFFYKRTEINNNYLYYGLTVYEEGLDYLDFEVVSPSDQILHEINNYAYYSDYGLIVFTMESNKEYGVVTISEKDVVLGEDIYFFGLPSADLTAPVFREGMLSKKEDDYLMFDSSVNIGDLGGPLFNLSGEVIGIAVDYLSYFNDLGDDEYIFGYGLNKALKLAVFKEYLLMLQLDNLNGDLTKQGGLDNYQPRSEYEALQIALIDEIIDANVFILDGEKLVSPAVVVKREGNAYYFLTKYREEIITSFDYLTIKVGEANYFPDSYYYDNEEKIIIIKFESYLNLKVVPLSESEIVVGEGLVFGGADTSNAKHYFTKGMVSKSSKDDSDYFMVDGPVNYYQIGAGVFNFRSELVGILADKSYQYERDEEIFIVESITSAYRVNKVMEVLNNSELLIENSSFLMPNETSENSYQAKGLYEEKEITLIANLLDSVVNVITDKGHGSGTIYYKEELEDGYLYYLLTNKHVIDGGEDLKVKTNDNITHLIESYYQFDNYDIAVLRFKSDLLYPIKEIKDFSINYQTMPGTIVYAAGTPLSLEYFNLVTKGVTGYGNLKHDQVDDLALYVDVALNPGNSGGALFNYEGEFIGINTAKYTNYHNAFQSDFARGASIVIDLSKVKAEILALQEEGFVVFQRKVMLGITIVSIVDYQTEYGYDYFPLGFYGLVVMNIDETRGAFGVLEVGDNLYKINGKKIYGTEIVATELNKLQLGDIIVVKVKRIVDNEWVSLELEIILK